MSRVRIVVTNVDFTMSDGELRIVIALMYLPHLSPTLSRLRGPAQTCI